jgi:hypothetical protein
MEVAPRKGGDVPDAIPMMIVDAVILLLMRWCQGISKMQPFQRYLYEGKR